MAQNSLLLAQAVASGNASSSIFMIVGLFLIMYFVMIRPQQKQMKQQQAMLAGLKKGDEVITQGGLVGEIYALNDKMVTLEIANSVRVKILKSAVQGKVSVAELEAPPQSEKNKEAK